MKWTFLLGLLALAGIAPAEPESMAIAFSDPAKPKTLRVDVTMAGITVKGGPVSDVRIDAKGGFRSLNGRPPRGAEGLKRVQLPGSTDVKAEEKDNVVTISGWQGGELLITVPVDTNVKLKSTQGDIQVEGITGEIEANGSMGSVRIRDAQNSVLAHSAMGDVVASVARMSDKPVSLATAMGKVDLTLPAAMKATLLIREGAMSDVYSDFDITPAGRVEQTLETSKSKRLRSMTKATINGGGPDIQLSTSMGDIMIRKRN
jgi:hypothetical protein